MRIIAESEEGCRVLIPAPKFLAALPAEWTEEEKLIYVANKDLPTGARYEIVGTEDVPIDRSFRNAWEYVAGDSEKVSAELDVESKVKHNKKLTPEETEEYNAILEERARKIKELADKARAEKEKELADKAKAEEEKELAEKAEAEEEEAEDADSN